MSLPIRLPVVGSYIRPHSDLVEQSPFRAIDYCALSDRDVSGVTGVGSALRTARVRALASGCP